MEQVTMPVAALTLSGLIGVSYFYNKCGHQFYVPSEAHQINNF